MAESVARLAAIATLNTDNFVQNVDKMQKKLKSFRSYQQAESEKSSKYGMFGDIGDVAKSAKMVSRLMKAFTVVEAGLGALSVATKLWNNDISGAQKSLEELPMGIGKIIKEIGALREEWGLMPQEFLTLKLMGEQKVDQAAVDKAMKAVEEANIKRTTGFSRNALDIGNKAKTNAYIASLPEFDREVTQARQKLDEKLERLDKDYAEVQARIAGTSAKDRKDAEQNWLYARYQMEQESNAEINNIEAKRTENLERELEKRRKSEEDSAREEQRRYEDAIAWVDMMQSAKTQTATMALRMQGRDTEAKRLQSSFEFALKMEEARRDGNEELLRELGIQQQIADIELQRERFARGGAVQFDPTRQARGAMVRFPKNMNTGQAFGIDDAFRKNVAEIAVVLRRNAIQNPLN